VADSPLLARISTLILDNIRIGAAGVQALTQSPHLTRLARLSLRHCHLEAAAVQPLQDAPSLTALTELDLSWNELGDGGAQTLAASRFLAKLTRLNLSCNQIGDPGVQALADSPYLVNLTELDLGSNRIGVAGKAILAASQHWVQVVKPASWFPKPAQMTIRDRPLSRLMADVHRQCQFQGNRILRINHRQRTPDFVQQRIYDHIMNCRQEPSHLNEKALDDMGQALGTLWGESVCRELGWEWAEIVRGEQLVGVGIVSPTRSLVICPVPYIRRLLADRTSDPTSLLLYNMLKAGSIPEGQAGSYTAIG
jgi:hypothetical protein